MNTPNDQKYVNAINALADAHSMIADLLETHEAGPAERDVLDAARCSLERAQRHANGARKINRYGWKDTVEGAIRRVAKGVSTTDDAAILRRATK